MNELKSLSNSDLISRMNKLVRTERKITHLVLQYILEIEERRIYAELGFDGMYSYLVRGLGYSEGSAYRRLQSARLLKQVPEVALKIEDGSLNLSQMTQVKKCIDERTKKGRVVLASATIQAIEKVAHQNTFETQKVLAKEFDLPIVQHENIKPQKDESVRLEITLSKDQFEQLESAKNLLSHICHEGNWADVICHLAKVYNKNKGVSKKLEVQTSEVHFSEIQQSGFTSIEECQVKRKVLAAMKEPKVNPPSNSAELKLGMISMPSRKYISVHTKRELLHRAGSCCEYIDKSTGKKCVSKYQLQIDHIQPLARGGSDEKRNLRILCRTHNLLMAKKAGLLAI